MTLSIHPCIYRRSPTRARYLKEVLDHTAGHDGVALMTASQIGDPVIATRCASSSRGHLANEVPRSLCETLQVRDGAY